MLHKKGLGLSRYEGSRPFFVPAIWVYFDYLTGTLTIPNLY